MATNKQILMYLHKICSSTEFGSKKKICKLLCYILAEKLACRENRLKGYSIGIALFKRTTDFDAEHDPIVRIQVGRLRRSLELYYSGEGKDDEVVINIPKGIYIPKFITTKAGKASRQILPVSKHEAKNSSNNLPSIAVLPFTNLSGKRLFCGWLCRRSFNRINSV